MDTKTRKEEELKPNEVNAAYLFLGVGGAGCDIIKQVAKMCHPTERENISFVCMDTDVNDLKRIKDELPYVKVIQTSTTQTVGGFLDNDVDARKNWFPKSAVMYDKTMSEGAGQVRAISRLALDATIKTRKITPLYDAIDELFRKSGKELKQSMRLIIASSSSGGTGSGMILPISMFVRNYVKEKYPNAAILTRAMLLLPEVLDSVIESQTERDSQARNGYATIKEINAFMMKGSGFVDLDPDLWQYRDLHVDIPIAGSDKLTSLSTLPIDFCFLMDGQDAEDSTMMNYSQYKQQAAIALYEQNIGPMQRKATSTEDNIIKELANSKGRNRFGGIGAGILRYPYEMIVDYVARDLAMDSIGGEGLGSKWTKYDKDYAIYLKEQKNKGVAISSCKTLGEFYTEDVDSKAQSGADTFSKDLMSIFLDTVDADVDAYLAAFEEAVVNQVNSSPDINAKRGNASKLKNKVDYTKPNEKGKLSGNISAISSYLKAVKEKDKDGKYLIDGIAGRFAEGLFTSEAKTVGEERPFCVESLLKNSLGEVAHPCAARYYIYTLQKKIAERLASTDNKDAEKNMRSLESENKHKLKHTKEEVKGLTGLASAVGKASPSFIMRLKGYDSIYDEVNKTLPNGFLTIEKFSQEEAKHAAYEKAYEYIRAYAEEYENFFKTFEDKVKRLTRDKDDIVNELSYKKGNSTLNICSEKSVLEELSRTALAKTSQESTMLSSEINGAIFDQIKKNAVYNIRKKIAGDDLTIENTHRGIFDETLMGYFKDQVREKCDEINVDVINAIVLEYKLVEGLKARASGTDFLYTVKDAESYLKSKIEMGKRIAAPSIQRMLNVEPREIKRCAYNKILDENRVFIAKNLLESGDATETVSKYEIRFFNALYNITPDKLKKFAAPFETETGKKYSGTYHRAYYNYSKLIGPDSTKNAAMSTHIDKRWDNIKEMPELDEAYQKEVIKNIHKAFIYGIIHGAIQHAPLSAKAGGKMVYSYKDSDDRTETLVVPNGTLCDEFYEVLDALYINAKVVEDINEVIKQRKRAMSIMKNCNYEDTEFFKDMAKFNLFDFYKGGIKAADEISTEELKKIAKEITDNAMKEKSERNPDDKLVENSTSLFAIPMVYYYSLPNSARYVSELNSMVDAVIDVFREEYKTWEKEEDVKFVLCDRLCNEFDLLKRNYGKYEKEAGMNVPPEEQNEVMDVIRRKIQDEIRSAPEPEDYEMLLDMIAKRGKK